MVNDKIFLDNELERVWKKIINKENFTLLRYGDGERAIMEGKSVKAQEGWISPSHISELGQALINTLDFTQNNIIYAISCPCCDRAAYYWYSTRIKSKNKTFANIFINNNYKNFIKYFEKLDRDAVFIGNYRGKNAQIGNLHILKYYTVSDNCFDFWDKNAEQFIQQIINEYGKRNNLLYVVSAGPMSEPIIAKLYNNNPNNCYIDFGSAIDKYIHKTKTRPYENPNSKYGKRNCWMYNPHNTNFDVSIVLTLYKRPQNLKLQLENIKQQTLKPKEILLFQDKTADNTIIEIPENLKNEFNLIKIVPENVGVWGRFNFAQKANSEYVCIFDDDTIPGKSWLENCHFEMQKQEGIYGTIGILMKKPEKYPFGEYIRLGWDGPSRKTHKVDFVGHSWFCKKEWLEYMFKNTQKYQNFKFVGEDMCLSFQLKKILNIDTFVPPHPTRHKELWGSQPELARTLGTEKSAIHLSSNNSEKMNIAINEYLKDGVKTLSFYDKFYVTKMFFYKKLAFELTRYIPNKNFRYKLRNKIKEFLYQ